MIVQSKNQPTTSSSLPARLDAVQTAEKLGFSEHDIPILVNRGLLKPLGNPVPNARKYFARVEIEQIDGDVKWLDKASKAISQHWQKKNSSRKNKDERSSKDTDELSMSE
jgi:hypothetical protein